MNLLQSSLTVNTCSERKQTVTSPLVVLRLLLLFGGWRSKGAAVDFSSGVCICVTSVNRGSVALCCSVSLLGNLLWRFLEGYKAF